MPIGWYIGISSGSILFLVAFFLLSCANYKKRFNTRYDLRNHFPYEFNFESHFSLNLLGNLALIMGIACSIGLFALTASEFNKNGYVLYALISGVLFSLFAGLINFIPLKTIKTHMVFSVLLFAAAFATPAAIGLSAFKIYQETKEVFPLAIFIMGMVFTVFAFGLVMNPKLTLNIKMMTLCIQEQLK